MKKQLSILTAGIIFATVLAISGCGTNDDEQNPPPQNRIQDYKGNDLNQKNGGRVDEDGLPSDTKDDRDNRKRR